MTIVVRRATDADAELVSALNADVQAIHAAALPWWFKPPKPDTFPAKEFFALLPERPESLVFLAYADRQPAGYAYAEVVHRPETSHTFAFEMVHIHHISVASEFRRRGVGSALLGAVRASGLELGIGLLTPDVWSFNKDARAFFQRNGFSPYIEQLWCR
jgi:ribosomal protein S18 acetylase RimI-like enzyme